MSSQSDLMAVLRRMTRRFLFPERPYSRLHLQGDGGNWSISRDACEVGRIIRKLGIVTTTEPIGQVSRQGVFYFSKYVLANDLPLQGRESYLAYYHGYPDDDNEQLREMFKLLVAKHRFFQRIQVTHRRMLDYCLEAGMAPEKLSLIRIGLNSDLFVLQTPELGRAARERYGIPSQATVIGSFQKDGNGWEHGDTPKLIKGPDIFLQAMKILKEDVPELFVFLSGPARGYVMNGLTKIGVPFRHVFLDDYREIGSLFHCLDLYVVCSREEGGPKAVFESMASGVPLVCTDVGQAADVIHQGKNGFLVEVEDAEAVAARALQVLDNSALRTGIVEGGLMTAAENSYDSQLPEWKAFFKDSRLLPEFERGKA